VDDDRDEASHAARIGDLSLQLNDAAAAVHWYQKSELLAPLDASLLTRLADAQSKTGQLDNALATLARAMEKDPTHAAARVLARRLQAR
jgi:tetratricopeptide (TPR) repeat protein